jgi:phosphate starvation-inducible PhoH-like protein
VEAGERLGFLPGDMKDKVDPYMQPLYDALNDFLPGKQVAKLIEEKRIEIAPLAFMRGRTLANAFVVLDEAQNATTMQMKMFLTRLGEGSRMVITGDRSQVDLPRGVPSGLADAERLLKPIDKISFNYFTSKDVVRHPLVAAIIEAYDADGVT